MPRECVGLPVYTVTSSCVSPQFDPGQQCAEKSPQALRETVPPVFSKTTVSFVLPFLH